MWSAFGHLCADGGGDYYGDDDMMVMVMAMELGRHICS